MNRPSSHASTRRGRCARSLILLAAFAATAGTAAAQPAANDPAAPLPPRIDDRRLGEVDRIESRAEWFLSSRRAGVPTGVGIWSLRKAGVEQTRAAIARQTSRRSVGVETQQNFWVPMGPSPSTFGGWAFGNVSGRIQAIEADWAGGTLYVGGAAGGVWKSTNDGLSWTHIFDTAGTTAVGAITVDPADPSVLWVGTGDNIVSCESYFGIGLLRSPDGGTTWQPRNGSGGTSLEELASFADIVVDPRDSNHVIVGGRYRGCESGSQQTGGLYRSIDGGLTWTAGIPNTAIHGIAQDPTVLDVFWAATGSGVYKSVNNGVSWVRQSGSGLPTTNAGRVEIAIAPSDGNTVYALFSSGPSFWRTTDGGATWQQMSSGGAACDGQCTYNMVIRVHQSNPSIVYRGTVHIFRSVNGGASWTDLSNSWGSSQKVHQDMHAMLMHPSDPNAFYVSGDGGIWKTVDSGDSFTNLNGNLNVTQFYAIGVDAADPERICGGAQDNSSLARSTDNVWDRQWASGDGFVCHIDPQDPDYAYVTSYPSGGYPHVRRSSTGLFGSFTGITGSGSGISNGDRINWVTPYLLDPTSPSTLYLGTHRVYRSDNRGGSWSLTSPDLTGGSGSLKALEINRSFPDHVFSGSGSGKVWRTTDGGQNWSDISSGLPPRGINDVAADPGDPDRAFAVVGGFNTAHVWEWNAASGWVARDAGLPNVPANSVVMLTSSDLLVGTDTGVFRSFDGGLSFLPYMNGLPEGLVVTDLKFNVQQNVVTAGTYGRGAWQVVLGPPQPLLTVDPVVQPLTEVDGDGDDRVEPGETWSLRPVLRNSGAEAALGATARLTTTTAGVSIVDQIAAFGNIDPGQTVPAVSSLRFVVDPSFPCAADVVFDVIDVRSDNAEEGHSDKPAALTVTVVDSYDSSVIESLVNENFDPAPGGWVHEAVDAGLVDCPGFPHSDEWNLATKDAAHGTSYHCGNGPGGSISRGNYAWLHPAGKDSEDGAGVAIPQDAIAATLTLVHWYDTVETQDGGQVVLDAVDNDIDVYTALSPVGGYPGPALAFGNCNGLGGQQAFQGSSSGWVTDTFDLLQFRGAVIYPAFVFGSDRLSAGGEGWYIDEVRIEFQRVGEPICQVLQWPGSVDTGLFELLDPSTVAASWSDSCNVGAYPAQAYSIQAGDLDALTSGGTYTHAPVAGRCDYASPATFTPGPGNEYYLIVPAADGREGGAGTDAGGVPRPSGAGTCGERRVACP